MEAAEDKLFHKFLNDANHVHAVSSFCCLTNATNCLSYSLRKSHHDRILTRIRDALRASLTQIYY